MGAERRRTIRYPFDAAAEVSEDNAQGTLAVRVSEISLNGCYLQTASPFPAGTALFVKVFSEGIFFEAHATVAYAQAGMGMGVAFRDLKPYFVNVLKKWLLAAMFGKHKQQD
jgi:hypothetical protein